ncbi:MAG: TVP38/TMEM64 family protein [Azospirillum sp.]|nr:TVP38/TMEM64 family protein [Azospirillum sp.]
MAVPETRPTADHAPSNRPVWRWLPLALLAAGFTAFVALGGGDWLSFAMLSQNYGALEALVAGYQVEAALVFMAVYALSTAFSVPGGVVLTVAGGCLFGTGLATAYVVLGATAGAVAVFLAARTALGDLLRHRAGPWLTRLEAGFKRDAFSYLLVLRLVPLFPFWLVNLVPAFLGVSLTTYTVTTVVGIIPGAFVYASVGNGVATLIERGGTPDLGVIFAPEILLPILGLAVLAMIPVAYRWLVGRRAGRP